MGDTEHKENVDTMILESAEDHFAEKGFHDTKVSEIADDAGVGKGTVYRHFGKKSALFAGLIEDVTDNLTRHIERVISEVDNPTIQVREIYREHMKAFHDARPLMKIFVNEGLRKTGEHREAIVQQWRTYRETIAGSFERGTQEGAFIDCDPSLLTRVFTSWIWGILRNAVIFNEIDHAENDGDLMIDVFLEGITAEND